MVLLWQRAISLVVLSVLAVLPVSGTVCAALCVPSANAALVSGDHHAPASPCHEPVYGQPSVQGTTTHDCDRHDGPAREATATLTAVRSDMSVLSVTQHLGPATPSLVALTSVGIHSGSSPPGAASASHAPLVLRI